MASLPSSLTTEYDRLIDEGDWSAAKILLAPLVEIRDPEAIFLWSMLSPANEADDEFEIRHVAQIRDAAAMGYIPAIYTLGFCHRFGDGVARDVALAASLFQVGAEAGYPAAQYEYGLALLHGIGARQDLSEAARLIRAAADGGDEVAQDFLRLNPGVLSEP